MSAIADRVAAGAAFLDESDPEWWRADVDRAIDLDTLELARMDNCVLGQRCPVSVLSAYVLGPENATEDNEDDVLSSIDFLYSYRAYGHALSGIKGHIELQEWAQGLGFNAHGGEQERVEFADLTAEWKRVISGRRAAA